MPPITSIFIAAATPTVDLPDPNSYQAIGWLIVALAIVIGSSLAGIYYALEIWARINPRRNPPIEAEFATKADMAKLEADLDARIVGMSQASAQSREKVYVKLAEVGSSVIRLEERLQSQGDRLTERLATQADRLNELTESNSRQFARLEAKLDAAAVNAAVARQAQNNSQHPQH